MLTLYVLLYVVGMCASIVGVICLMSWLCDLANGPARGL